ncbi:7-carboxy-7-deazaguanine synthase [Rhodovibrionaceae bacterium A322]
MTYSVKELFFTLQGEGANAGRPAVFCRFSGCNLWTGREQDRASAICRFCDTDFVGTDGEGGGKFKSAQSLVEAIEQAWLQNRAEDSAAEEAARFVVCTGGEPALQLDDALVTALHGRGFTIAIETNGTLPLPDGIDWICVSPKAGQPLVITRGQELKLVYPQAEETAQPEHYQDLAFDHHFLQPLDDADQIAHTQAVTAYCLAHPRWKLSLQTHKLIGIP